jgi:hypothetical protein
LWYILTWEPSKKTESFKGRVDGGYFQKKAELPKDENSTIHVSWGDREGSDNIEK